MLKRIIVSCHLVSVMLAIDHALYVVVAKVAYLSGYVFSSTFWRNYCYKWLVYMSTAAVNWLP